MPNVKIYAEEGLAAERAEALREALPGLRELLCAELKVGPEACQIALMPVAGLPDQPPVNVELLILPRPDRDAGTIRSVAARVREIFTAASGAHTAVRVSQLDPETYVALK